MSKPKSLKEARASAVQTDDCYRVECYFIDDKGTRQLLESHITKDVLWTHNWFMTKYKSQFEKLDIKASRF